MSEPKIDPPRTRSGFAIWKLAVAEASLLALIAGWFAFSASVSVVNWAALDSMDKFIIIGGAVMVVATNVVAFLNKTVAKTEAAEKETQPP